MDPALSPPRFGRRALLLGVASAGAAHALGRIPYGGRLALTVPWPLGEIDPHAIDDPAAALFGRAIADPLFSLDAQGRPYPALAARLPERTPKGTRVALRPQMSTARGRGLDSRDLVFSLGRSAARGGLSLLSPFGRPTRDPDDALAVLIPGADPDALARALSSPVTALLPRAFRPAAPDGTGAFRATTRRDSLTLERNLHAARGAAFLDRIHVARAADLAGALRAFEAGEADVGWLGRGLHRPRAGAVDFDAGPFGWVVLRTGRDAGSWGAPGVAQGLLDAIPPSRLSYLGLHGLPSPRGSYGWGGAPADLLVRDDAPHLVEIARALAALLSRPGHEVRPAPRAWPALTRLRARRRFSLMLDFVRPIGPPGPATLAALLTAADPALARHPPRLTTFGPRSIARTLSLGIVGELRIAGAHIPGINGLARWNLGAVWRPR